MTDQFKVGDIIHLKDNPKLHAYITEIQPVVRGGVAGYDKRYYVKFHDGPYADHPQLVVYYYQNEMFKVE
jgi:hypothetical protein